VQGDPIQPASSYQLRQWGAIFGMANLTSTVDQTLDFASRSRVTIAGSASDPVVDQDPDGDGVDNIEVINFTDPQTNTIYRAIKFDTESSSIGYSLLKEAQKQVDDIWQPAKDAVDANDTAANRAALDAASVRLNEKIQIIDFMRYLGDVLEFPGG
jgi:hypothetical protein